MPQNLIYRQVHKVPVIGLLGILQVERHDFISLLDGLLVMFQSFRGQSLKLVDKDQETAETDFVLAGHQQFRNFT